jgi:hypothetical protein
VADSPNKRLRERSRGKKPLGGLVSSVIDTYGLEPRLRELRALMAWDDAVGPRIARRARPSRLDGGILYVRVTSSPWLAELSFHKTEMAAKLNQAVGTEVVREVRLHIGPLPTGDVADEGVGVVPPPPKKRPLPLAPEKLPAETLARIDAEIAALDDPDLRAAVGAIRRKLGG